jgi:hypothetical protein
MICENTIYSANRAPDFGLRNSGLRQPPNVCKPSILATFAFQIFRWFDLEWKTSAIFA